MLLFRVQIMSKQKRVGILSMIRSFEAGTVFVQFIIASEFSWERGISSVLSMFLE